MKLYELKRFSYFTIEDGDNGSQERFRLDKIDGAYSVCYTEDEEMIHLSANTPVRPHEGYLA